MKVISVWSRSPPIVLHAALLTQAQHRGEKKHWFFMLLFDYTWSEWWRPNGDTEQDWLLSVTSQESKEQSVLKNKCSNMWLSLCVISGFNVAEFVGWGYTAAQWSTGPCGCAGQLWGVNLFTLNGRNWKKTVAQRGWTLMCPQCLTCSVMQRILLRC